MISRSEKALAKESHLAKGNHMIVRTTKLWRITRYSSHLAIPDLKLIKRLIATNLAKSLQITTREI